MRDVTRTLFGFTQHPDKEIGREKLRHLVNASDRSRTLCGHRVAWLFDYATPLAPDCRQCARVESRKLTTPATR